MILTMLPEYVITAHLHFFLEWSFAPFKMSSYISVNQRMLSDTTDFPKELGLFENELSLCITFNVGILIVKSCGWGKKITLGKKTVTHPDLPSDSTS